MSPSARKVWIEMVSYSVGDHATSRRLPQGRCGLKYSGLRISDILKLSPSARKVWIEMLVDIVECSDEVVAFRKEGVD